MSHVQISLWRGLFVICQIGTFANWVQTNNHFSKEVQPMLVNYGAEYVACDNTELCRQYAAKQQEIVKYEQMAAKARFELLELWAQMGPGDSESSTNLKTLKQKASTLIQSQTSRIQAATEIPIRTVLADARNKQLETKFVAFGDKTSKFVNDLFKPKRRPSHDLANCSFDIENLSEVEDFSDENSIDSSL